ncbi:MAG: Fe-S-binding domain-containing protein, partial [bacterium]
LSAVYLLWMYQRVMHGPVTVVARPRMVEITTRELLIFIPLILLIFGIGLYPAPLLERSEASVRALLERVEARR